MKKLISKKLAPVGLIAIVVIVTAMIVGALVSHQISPVSASARIRIIPHGIVLAGDIPTTSGIENIYIIEHGKYTKTDNLSGHENLLGTIEASAGSVDIPYENSFDIVIAVKCHIDNMAYLTQDNMNVELAASNAFTITAENSADKNTFDDGSPTYLRINVVWDNTGAGYELLADTQLDIDSCKLWQYY